MYSHKQFTALPFLSFYCENYAATFQNISETPVLWPHAFEYQKFEKISAFLLQFPYLGKV